METAKVLRHVLPSYVIICNWLIPLTSTLFVLIGRGVTPYFRQRSRPLFESGYKLHIDRCCRAWHS